MYFRYNAIGEEARKVDFACGIVTTEKETLQWKDFTECVVSNDEKELKNRLFHLVSHIAFSTYKTIRSIVS